MHHNIFNYFLSIYSGFCRVNEEDKLSSQLSELRSNSTETTIIEKKLNLTSMAYNTTAAVMDYVQKDEDIVSLVKNINNFRENHILIYSITMGVLLVLTLTRSYSFFRMCMKISRNLHEKLYACVTRATMYFFNRNPSGRILNRFAQDIALIDMKLTITLVECITVSELSIYIIILN